MVSSHSTSLTISPMYMPEIIFSNLHCTTHRQTPASRCLQFTRYITAHLTKSVCMLKTTVYSATGLPWQTATMTMVVVVHMVMVTLFTVHFYFWQQIFIMEFNLCKCWHHAHWLSKYINIMHDVWYWSVSWRGWHGNMVYRDMVEMVVYTYSWCWALTDCSSSWRSNSLRTNSISPLSPNAPHSVLTTICTHSTHHLLA